MTNNGRFFTFLFSHSSKSSIYIQRVDVSIKLLQNALLCSAVVIGFSAFGAGIYGIVSTAVLADVAAKLTNPAMTQLSGSPPLGQIDYSRPDILADYSLNSGGPLDLSQLDSDDAELEKQLRTIQANANPEYLPSIWAHAGTINNEFGFRRNPFGGRTYEFHAGMDIDGERGDIVVAPANGIVTEAGWKGGYGNMIEIEHGNGLTTRYGHLSKTQVATGDSISRGQPIANIGSTGRSTGPHLHYELRLNGRPINPRRFLPPEPIELVKASE